VRHLRMVGLCLVAVFAIAAIAATSASALEWGKCVAKAGGKYTEGNCVKKATLKTGPGTFEWRKGSELANVPFTDKNVGSGGVLYAEDGECGNHSGGAIAKRLTRQACEATGNERVTFTSAFVSCAEEHSSGEASGTNEVKNVAVTFKGCNLMGAAPCQNGAPEEIKTNALKGKLGWLNKKASPKEVGVSLEPVKKNGAFVAFECPGLGLSVVVGVGNSKEGAAHVQGTKYPLGCTGACPGATPEEEKHGGYDSIISPIKPVNKMTTTYEQEYKVETNKECLQNTPSKFEGQHIDVLETVLVNTQESGKGSMWSCAGQEITVVNTLQPAGEEGEIKA
jgi:hypothetical protein